MLSLLIIHIVITAICSLTGLLFYSVLFKKNGPSRPLIFYPFTGLIVITGIAQLAVLFIPIDTVFTIYLLLFVLVTAFFKRNEVRLFYQEVLAKMRSKPSTQLFFAICAWLMILVLNAGPTMMDDTDSYHIQMVKWIHEYGTVPGIVNLHERFGFNSSWFTSISFFLPGDPSRNFYVSLNGVLSVWFCLFLVFRLTPFFDTKKQTRIAAIHFGILFMLILSFACWALIRGNASMANYDFITTMLVVVFFTTVLMEGKKIGQGHFVVELILWPAYLFTIRIINYPLLILSIYGCYLLIKSGEWRRLFLYLALSATLVLAFLARNIMIAGYPLYPSTAFNFFNVDWKADREMIDGLNRYIKYYNRVNEGFLSIDDTEKLKFPGWIAAWFRYMFYYDKPVFIAGLAGFLLNLVFVRRISNLYGKLAWIFIIAFLVQLISWFIIAPDPRFVYGCLLCGALLLPIVLIKNYTVAVNPKFNMILLVIFSIGILAFATLKPVSNESYRNFWLPWSLPQPPVKALVIDNIELRIPEKVLNNWNPRCYGTALPCLYRLDPRLHARGADVRDGFRLNK